MKPNFKDIKFPDDLEYSSDSESLPIEFYLETMPLSKEIHFKLGYFSSSAIQTLSYGFAQFIHNGGKIKIMSNHFMYNQDKRLLQKDITAEDAIKKEYLLRDLEWISNELNASSQHFFNCLMLLVNLSRLEIIPVMLKPGKMAHYKQGIFIDDKDNVLFVDGSCNFTANGLLENAETIQINRSWGENIEQIKTKNKRNDIAEIVDKKSDKYHYLDPSDILNAVTQIGEEKNIEELLIDEKNLVAGESVGNAKIVIEKYKIRLTTLIEKIRGEPKFPYPDGPRDYQSEACTEWLKAGKKGIFAMATGTGKTLTALNCLLNEFKNNGIYQAIILVPTAPLLEQWFDEVKDFNFKNIHRASSDYNWRRDVGLLNTQLGFDKTSSFIVITTYQTFSSSDFQRKVINFPDETLFIADEAHNMGRPDVMKILPDIAYSKRIALSATPSRRFDPDANERIEQFFNSYEPYTYSFSMRRAINEKILCSYDYFPHIVHLSQEEMDEYARLSKKLSTLFDHLTGSFRNVEYANKLLQDRRRIIHKAEGKLAVFRRIIDALVRDRGNLDYSFVYAPEGKDAQGDKILNQYLAFVADSYPSVLAHHYTSVSDNRIEIMKQFENGNINSLFSMKCLDEGIDVPRAEVAIFCSSTANPRQFIQRRGRILRQHKDKEYAVIHDLVVVPVPSGEPGSFEMEKKLIRDELIRVVHFCSLSRNYYDSMKKFKDIAALYELNMYSLEYELEGRNDEKKYTRRIAELFRQ